jgi:hypothetical protein
MQPTSPAFVPGSASVAAVASVPGRRSHSSRSTTNGANGGSGPGVTIVAGPVLYDPAPSSGTRNGGSGRDRTATNRRPATVPSSTAPGLLGQEQQQQPAGQRSRSGQGHQQRQPQPLQPQQDGQDPRPPRESRAELRAKETASGIVQDILRSVLADRAVLCRSTEAPNHPVSRLIPSDPLAERSRVSRWASRRALKAARPGLTWPRTSARGAFASLLVPRRLGTNL